MSRDLNFPPAFGWQTKNINADRRYYMPKAGPNCKNRAKHAQRAHVISNLAKGAGYFPGLGLAVGVGRIISVIVRHKDAHGKAAKVARAIGEIAGMGPLLFLADLVKHIARSRKADKVLTKLQFSS